MMERQYVVGNFLDRLYLLVVDQLDVQQNLDEQNLDEVQSFLVAHRLHQLDVVVDGVLRHLLKMDCYQDAEVVEGQLFQMRTDYCQDEVRPLLHLQLLVQLELLAPLLALQLLQRSVWEQRGSQ